MFLKNESDNKFFDVSTEEFRIYEFPNKEIVKIYEPVAVSVNKESGSHRILDNNGISHYIPSGWIHLFWKAKEGKPHFVKCNL